MRSALLCAIVGLSTIAFPSIPAYTQEIIETSPHVMSIIPDNDVVHVMTDRIDKNFNGLKDDGDSEATWTIIARGSNVALRSLMFPWQQVTVARPALDQGRGLMFIGVGDSVFAYTSRTQIKSETPVYEGSNVAVAIDNVGTYLYVSHRPSFTDPGEIHRIDLSTGMKDRTHPTLANPQQSLAGRLSDQFSVVATVCEGTFGNSNGGLTIDLNGTIENITLGDTPNHMAVDVEKGIAYIVLNGSHEVVLVDLVTRTEIDRWSTATSGFDGPREIAITDGYAFVTSYSSQIHVFDRTSGLHIGDLSIDAKADALAVIGSSLWIGRAFIKDTYTATGGILIYSLSVVSVADAMHDTRTTRALLVTSDILDLDRVLPGVDETKVFDMQGAMVSHSPGDRSMIDMSLLPTGTYVVRRGNASLVVGLTR
jgi:hypothetical protein